MSALDMAFLQQVAYDGFLQVAEEAAELSFDPGDGVSSAEERVAVIVGMTSRDGSLKGRILLDADQAVALEITEGMNGGPLEETSNLYFFLAEFVNMVGGRTLTAINNKYKGIEFRLSPPAVFAGKGLDLMTPKVRSHVFPFKRDKGALLLDVGFEGV